MNNDYILIQKMLTNPQIFKILDVIDNKNEQESKVGNRIAKEKKNKKRYIFKSKRE